MHTQRLLCAILAVGFALTMPMHAAKSDRRDKGGKRVAARMLARFDHDNDRKLDANEAARVRAAFQSLKALDANNDGELSDAEIGAAKLGKKGGPAKKRKQR